MNNSEGNILSFIAGVAVGALIGVLVAPDKGTETRSKIAHRSQKVRRDLEDQADMVKKRIEKATENALEKIEKVKQERFAKAGGGNGSAEEA